MNKTLTLLSLCILSGCVNRQAQEQAKKTEAIVNDSHVPVVIQVLQPTNIQDTVKIHGELAAENDTTLVAKVPGKINKIFVKEGDYVKKDSLILTLDDSDYKSRVEIVKSQVEGAKTAKVQAELNAVNGPENTSSALANAKSQLVQARAQYEKITKGPREEEKNQLKSALDAATKALEAAQNSFNRSKNLYKEGAISKQNLEQAEAKYLDVKRMYDSANETWNMVQSGARNEDVEAVKQQLRMAEEGLKIANNTKSMDELFELQLNAANANYTAATNNLKLAQSALDDTRIRAPFSGIISMQPASIGTMINPGMPITRVTNLEKVYFDADVPLEIAKQLRVGMKAMIQLSAKNTAPLSGSISAINLRSDKGLRLNSVRISVEPESANNKPQLYPGDTGEATITLSNVENVLIAPKNSVIQEGLKYYVMLEKDGKAIKKEVTLGSEQDNRVQIIGVSAADHLIVEGNTFVSDGSMVKIEKKLTN